MADSVDSGVKQDNTSDEFLDPSCDPCKAQGRYVKVVSYCPTCVEYFCKDCERAHANFQITKRHRLKYGSDMPACEADKPPKFQDCQIHANSIRDWFCVDHNVMICSKCKDQHGKCFIKNANDMSKVLEPNDIHKFLLCVTTFMDDISALKLEMEENVSEIESTRTSMLEKVNIEYEKMKAELARKFNASCEEINKTCSGHTATLTTQMSSLSDEIEGLDYILNAIKQERKSRLNMKLFVKMQSLVENVTESVKTVHEVMKGMKTTDLEFVEDKTWNTFLSNDTKFGSVQATSSQLPFDASLHNASFPPVAGRLFTEMHYHHNHTTSSSVTGAVEIGRLSSYTFGFFHNLISDVFNQHSRYMHSSDSGPQLKVPTTILIDPDREKLVAFGYEAQKRYADLLEEGQNADYYYFENCGKDLEEMLQSLQNEELTMKDATGKSLPTRCALVIVIKYLIKELMHSIHQCMSEPLESKYFAVAVVVPTLSTDYAKQTVHEVVVKTGIPPNNIVVIPEAQAVSQFCHSSIENRRCGDVQNIVAYGDDYMVVNFKEDNTEVIINKYTKSLAEKMLIAHINSVYEASINAAFEDFLQDIVGKDVYQAFANDMPEDLRYMQEDFENKKLHFDAQRYSNCNVKLPGCLYKMYAEIKGQTLKEALQQSRYCNDVKIAGDKLLVDSFIMRDFFDEPIIRTCMMLKSVLQTKPAHKIKCVVMTGKLSKTCEFQRAIKDAFPAINIVFPPDPDFAAVQGAVIHAYKQ